MPNTHAADTHENDTDDEAPRNKPADTSDCNVVDTVSGPPCGMDLTVMMIPLQHQPSQVS